MKPSSVARGCRIGACLGVAPLAAVLYETSSERESLAGAAWHGRHRWAFTKYSFYVDGSFSSSGAASCATTSVSGRVSGLRLTADDQPVYTITGIDIPAAAIQSDCKTLWTALNNPAAEVLASSQTALTISCTDGAGQSQSINVLSPSGIGAFLTKCLQ